MKSFLVRNKVSEGCLSGELETLETRLELGTALELLQLDFKTSATSFEI